MVKINKDTCIGCGLCVSICDEVFEIDESYKAYVKSQEKIPCVKEAINSCPVEAISE
ncbi:MAG: ferredoxin [archaeon]